MSQVTRISSSCSYGRDMDTCLELERDSPVAKSLAALGRALLVTGGPAPLWNAFPGGIPESHDLAAAAIAPVAVATAWVGAELIPWARLGASVSESELEPDVLPYPTSASIDAV